MAAMRTARNASAVSGAMPREPLEPGSAGPHPDANELVPIMTCIPVWVARLSLEHLISIHGRKNNSKATIQELNLNLLSIFTGYKLLFVPSVIEVCIEIRYYTFLCFM